MTISVPAAVLVTLVVAIPVFVLYLSAVHTRWFARFRHGFLVTLLIAIGGAGAGTGVVFGVWLYETGRQIVIETVVARMRAMGDILEGAIQGEVDRGRKQLLRLAGFASPDSARRRPATMRAVLREVRQDEPRFLQLNLVDRQGVVVGTSAGDREEGPDRVGIAFALEGRPFVSDVYISPVFDRYVLYLAVPIPGTGREPAGVLTAHWDVQGSLATLLGAGRINRTGHTLLANSEGRAIAHPVQARIREDFSSLAAVREGLDGRAGWLLASGPGGKDWLYSYRPLQSPATLARKPWVLVTAEAAAEAAAPIRELWDEFAVGLGLVLLVATVVAVQVSRWLRRPFERFLGFTRDVQDGDLTRRLAIPGRDDIGRLAAAMNGMVDGLQERERIKDLFGRYVTTQVSREILNGEVSLGGVRRQVTILFSDIRNFTAMSESLSPEEIVGFLNDYFSEMVDAVFEEQGILDKFLGDGMMATFGALDGSADHARRAVRAALRMKAALAKLNGARAVAGEAPIAIGIGIHTDEVVVGNIGSRKRLEYTAIGDGVNTCSRVESMNKEFGTTILVTESTFRELGDEFDCRPMPEAPLRGKSRVPRLFEVVSARPRPT